MNKGIPTSQSDYQFGLNLLNYLNSFTYENGHSVLKPLLWSKNSYLLEHWGPDELTYNSLFQFEPGQSQFPSATKQKYDLGRFLATMHNHIGEFEPSFSGYKWNLHNGITRSINQIEKFQGDDWSEMLKELG